MYKFNVMNGEVRALGLLYQWGRKDPFLSSSSIVSESLAASTLSWPSRVISSSEIGTIDYAIKHPLHFIAENEYNFDWYYTGDSSTDDTRWQTSDKPKGLYDPCPTGWRVPNGGNEGVWSSAFGTSTSSTEASNWDYYNKGMNFATTNITLGTGTIWYPSAGRWPADCGHFYDFGNQGFYWSCETKNVGHYALYLHFNSDGTINQCNNSARADAQSVRCIKESE